MAKVTIAQKCRMVAWELSFSGARGLHQIPVVSPLTLREVPNTFGQEYL